MFCIKLAGSDLCDCESDVEHIVWAWLLHQRERHTNRFTLGPGKTTPMNGFGERYLDRPRSVVPCLLELLDKSFNLKILVSFFLFFSFSLPLWYLCTLNQRYVHITARSVHRTIRNHWSRFQHQNQVNDNPKHIIEHIVQTIQYF